MVTATAIPCLTLTLALLGSTLTVIGTTLPVSATETIDFEQIVPAGSYVVSPELPALSADFTLQAGTLHGSNQFAHQADWRYGQSRTSELISNGIHYRLISHAGADWTPESFRFALASARHGAEWQVSNPVIVRGISEPVRLRIENGEYRVNDSGFTSAPGWISAGQQLQLRHLASSQLGGTVNSLVFVGNATGKFSSVLADMDPDPFTFTAVTGAALGVLVTSNTVTISGIDEATPISVTGGMYNINAGAYTSAAGTVNDGDVVRVQLTSSASYETEQIATLTVGSYSTTFSVTTLAYSTGGGGGGGGGGYGSGGGSAVMWWLLPALAWRWRLRQRR